jgi:hypothetical protein
VKTKNGDVILQVIIAAAFSLRLWDLNTPRQLKDLSLGSEIVRVEAAGDILHCITSGMAAFKGGSLGFTLSDASIIFL